VNGELWVRKEGSKYNNIESIKKTENSFENIFFFFFFSFFLLYNIILQTCLSCPDGGECNGAIDISHIPNLFGWQVSDASTDTHPAFVKCLYKPACLGRPNTKEAEQFYDENNNDLAFMGK
jgi:hypothetical protein